MDYVRGCGRLRLFNFGVLGEVSFILIFAMVFAYAQRRKRD